MEPFGMTILGLLQENTGEDARASIAMGCHSAD